jgi:DNA-binding NarL/FixJ family response regulator
MEEGSKLSNDLLTLVEFDGSTGLETIRELTPDEVQEREELAQKAEANLADIEAKQSARASALAKLVALGLTEDEIAAL